MNDVSAALFAVLHRGDAREAASQKLCCTEGSRNGLCDVSGVALLSHIPYHR
jgi:hypothetical protein